MTSFRTILFALPLVVVSSLTACATDASSEDTADQTGAASVAPDAPITLANYVTHPKIKAVRQEVEAINALHLFKSVKTTCDGWNEKWTDGSGKIRKIVSSSDEGGFEAQITVYYDDQGRPLFLFGQEADWTGERTNGDTERAFIWERRSYFDAQGNTIFQAVREDIAKGFEVALSTPDRLPESHEKTSAKDYADAEAMFSYQCGKVEDGT